MVGHRPGDEIGGELTTPHVRGMPVDDPPLPGLEQHGRRLPGDEAQVVHGLAEPADLVAQHQFRHVGLGEEPVRALEGRRRHRGRDRQPQIERQSGVGLQVEVHAGAAEDVHDLVRLGDGGGDAVHGEGFGEPRRREQ